MDFFTVSKCLIATPSLHLPKNNLVVPSPSRTATPSHTINNYDMGWKLALMSRMETESPDITNSFERSRISPEIKEIGIIINRCTELVKLPDTDDNQEMKAILRASIDHAQRKKGCIDLASENDKEQVTPEENNETATPKPKTPPPIHLKMKETIRDQLRSIYQKFPGITNKTSGDFIKLIANDIEEYHALTKLLEGNK
ncbi:uncharacterized protein TNCV_3162511 [Trichonephila clavipes]|nr:uncharacterized protein TNCV_3162511 [Trichonephila clavipes]